jgi:hypothetical protein
MNNRNKKSLKLIKKIFSKLKNLNEYLSCVLFNRQIHCKFFKRGEGICPFGSKCFYLHVDKHGQPINLGPPRRRQRMNARGELENYSDVFMVSVFSNEDIGRFFDEYVHKFSFLIYLKSLLKIRFSI